MEEIEFAYLRMQVTRVFPLPIQQAINIVHDGLAVNLGELLSNTIQVPAKFRTHTPWSKSIAMPGRQLAQQHFRDEVHAWPPLLGEVANDGQARRI
jgi:hypothetical protein